ncbi:hypothetical protein L211DRAFT_803162 [Terfezia boudieri ATCC MYA-4762]|uniref:Uncharacterized protein n=1 Tax=Terfezia boudieri ATCC MYA-4762 TaxID=1051890 RepID=A0A3N4M3H8_9PEZI|nr:hypothetical protein L211DRAFT_803162 [Terfezia boudieri ATCC MYA-4762]
MYAISMLKVYPMQSAWVVFMITAICYIQVSYSQAINARACFSKTYRQSIYIQLQARINY